MPYNNPGGYDSSGTKSVSKKGTTSSKVSDSKLTEPNEGATNHSVRSTAPGWQRDEPPTAFNTLAAPEKPSPGSGVSTSMGSWPIQKGPTKPDKGLDG